MVGYDRGFHLLTTPLWVNAHRARELAVLTQLTRRLPPRHRRAVASVTLAQLLARVGYRGSVLPLAWRRPVGVAGETLELIDVGGRSGAAAVLVEKRGQRVLLAGLVPHLAQAPCQWPRADIVAGSFPALGHPGLPIETIVDEAARFARVAQAEASASHILVDLLDVGLELIARLKECDVPVNPVGMLGKVLGGARRRNVRVTIGLVGRKPSPRVRRILGVDSAAAPMDWAPAWMQSPHVVVRPLRWLATWDDVGELCAATQAASLCLADVPPQQRERDVPALRTARAALMPLRFVAPAQQLRLAATAMPRRAVADAPADASN